MESSPILVAGGAGFIGTHFVKLLVQKGWAVLVLDALTYAGNSGEFDFSADLNGVKFVQGNIGDRALVGQLLAEYRPQAVVNFAAETHVDRSISNPEIFMESNTLGVFYLLQESFAYWKNLDSAAQSSFRFLQVSTDEVFGDLRDEEPSFKESSPYRPNSPYAASKAAGDHFVRAWFQTYGFPSVTTYSTNNYGPGQHFEKLIPMVIKNAMGGSPIPIYGSGNNIRDWLYVEDHCQGILQALIQGLPGETYGFSGSQEFANIDVAQKICQYLDQIRPMNKGLSYKKQICLTKDRLGHDWKYSFCSEKSRGSLNFSPQIKLTEGLEKTVESWLNIQK